MRIAKTYLLALIAMFVLSCKKEEKPAIIILENNETAQALNNPDTEVQVTFDVAEAKNTTQVKSAGTPKRDAVIAYAKKFLGTSYCYASADPKKGFDCSGFVNYVFDRFDIDLPRSSKNFKNLAPGLKPKEFKKGDVLVFYGYKDSTSIGHVGIVYEADGMNSKFIHASSGGEKEVMISDLGSDMYTKRFYKCINVLNLK
ncbi:C40 family peptidase [Flavobacterium rhizosphaerae]|uniref:C40 family peptidase n=1 Tax=Flavobacterium rhizosphaerae TaxID=3163298 RepID=A0ABW8YT47_9FLAO